MTNLPSLSITPGRKYLTRGGEVVSVFMVDHADVYPVKGRINGRLTTYTSGGVYRLGRESECDIVAECCEPADAAPSVAESGYIKLSAVLNEAVAQAVTGKGNERHANGRPFDEQPIMEIGRMLGGPEGHFYQVIKKAQEANGMAKRGDRDAAVRELMGVINYAAAAVIIRESSHSRAA